jgi:thioredoxin-related protein
MKKVIGVIVALFFSSICFSQGIVFEQTGFAEVLAKAKKENKMIFMDCYTSWCGPCKLLAKKVFPQKEVGDYFNEHFVSIKVDMEKGEGIELAKKYEILSYPTLLFMNADGKVLHKGVGALSAEALIADGKIAIDPNQRIDGLAKKYANGERGEAFIAKYIQLLKKEYQLDEMEKVGREFLANYPIEKIDSEDTFTILSITGVEGRSKEYNYLIANKAKFVELVGEYEYNSLIWKTIYSYLDKVAKTSKLKKLKSEIAKCKEEFDSPYWLTVESKSFDTYYISNGKFTKWLKNKKKEADQALAKDKKSGLNKYLSIAYQMVKEPAFQNSNILEEVIELVLMVQKEGVNTSGCYFCLANLYKMVGNKEKALEYINLLIDNSPKRKGNKDMRVTNLKKEIENM